MSINIIKSVEIKENEIKANKLIEELHAKAKEYDAVVKKLSKEIAEIKQELKDYMGDAEVLLNKSGIELALWRQNKPSIKLDEDLVEERYPEAYNDCLIEVAGNLNFILR